MAARMRHLMYVIVHMLRAKTYITRSKIPACNVRWRTVPGMHLLYCCAMALNSLLTGLPRNGKGSFPGLLRVELAFGQVLHNAGKRIAHVYFPTSSLISLISDEKGGVPVELGVIGRDGMVGVALALGEERSGASAIVQGAGTAMQCSSEDFTREFSRRAGLRRDIRR